MKLLGKILLICSFHKEDCIMKNGCQAKSDTKFQSGDEI